MALLTYANNNPAVAGVDLHLHVASFNGDNGSENNRFPSLDSGLVGAVTFARTLVPTKPFISTEFSLVSYFLPFLKDPLSVSFTSKNATYAADAAASVAQDPDGHQTVLGFYNYAVARGNAMATRSATRNGRISSRSATPCLLPGTRTVS